MGYCGHGKSVVSYDDQYLSISSPYGIVEDSIIVIKLPDSLKGNDFVDGKVVFAIYISDSMHIDGVNLHYLILKKRDSSILYKYVNNYLQPILINNYPEHVKKYYSYFEEYFRQIKIYQMYPLHGRKKYLLMLPRKLE
jgi:hypothetical protein